MILKKYRIEFFLVIISICALFTMFFLNDINIHIRINELQQYLQKTNQTENHLDNLNLVTRYKLQMQMYNNEITQASVDFIELKVNSILKNIFSNTKFKLEKYEIISTPIVYIINLYRSLLDMSPIKYESIDTSNKFLEVAYYYERHNLINKALEFYEKSLRHDNLNYLQKYSILLHEGFCHSILGNYSKAKEKYTIVIKESNNQNLEVNAAILLKHLETFKLEVTKILNNEPDSVIKGEKLYNLIAYSDSINVLKKVEKKASPKEKARINYAKAKCFEAFGENEKAIRIYQGIILSNPGSKFSKMSNRRIFIIGNNSHNGKEIQDLAIKNNKVLKDIEFNKIYNFSQSFEKINKNENDLNKSDIFKNMLVSIEKNHPIITKKELEQYEKAISKKEIPIKEKIALKYKVFTRDGSIYIGEIINDTGKNITIKTIIGEAKVNKADIIKKEKL